MKKKSLNKIIFDLIVRISCMCGAISGAIIIIGCFVKIVHGENVVGWIMAVNVLFFSMRYLYDQYNKESDESS